MNVHKSINLQTSPHLFPVASNASEILINQSPNTTVQSQKPEIINTCRTYQTGRHKSSYLVQTNPLDHRNQINPSDHININTMTTNT